MPLFPRLPGALSILATPPVFPAALSSVGQSNKLQMRSVGNMGRTWTETYPLLDLANPNVRALIQALNQAKREGTVWDVQHPYWHKRSGQGGGSPLVAGAGQAGSTLLVDGLFTNALVNPLRFDQSPWTVGASCVITPNADYGPDGTLTACVLTDSNAVSISDVLQNITIPNDSAIHLVGTWVKKAPAGSPCVLLQITLGGGTPWSAWIVMDPVTGILGQQHQNVSGSVINFNANYWFIWLTVQNNNTGNTTLEVIIGPAGSPAGNPNTSLGSAQGSNTFWGSLVALNTTTPFAVRPWLCRGDVIQLPGSPVVFDVAGDIPAIGNVMSVPISPPIFVGREPADNAPVQIDPTQIFFKAIITNVSDYPAMDVTRFIPAGLEITFQEQPQ